MNRRGNMVSCKYDTDSAEEADAVEDFADNPTVES